jgi:hypothetical protein
MFKPKKLRFSQNLHYITVIRFKEKFVLLLNFVFVHTSNSLLVHKFVQSITENFPRLIAVCPIEVNPKDVHLSHRYILRSPRCFHRKTTNFSNFFRKNFCATRNYAAMLTSLVILEKKWKCDIWCRMRVFKGTVAWYF